MPVIYFNRKKAQNLFHTAYQAQMKGDYRRAINHYMASIQSHPTAEAHTFLGWTYSFLGELDLAIAECESAIAVDPEFGNSYNDIGAYLIAQGRHTDALPYLQKALSSKRYRAFHFAHFNLGRVYEHSGDFLNAYRHYKEALAIEPRYLIAVHAIERLKHHLVIAS